LLALIDFSSCRTWARKEKKGEGREAWEWKKKRRMGYIFGEGHGS